jgi:predicted dehydrogenase
VFSRDANKSLEMAGELGLDRARLYASFEEMAEREAARTDGVEVVSVVTSTESHYKICREFLEKGIPVVCDKPLTDSLSDAQALWDVCKARRLFIALTHHYASYGMVQQAAHLVRSGALGDIRMVQVEHASSWGSAAVELTGRKQAVWRTDPAIAGQASVLLDIGTHAHHLARRITGLEVDAVSAEMCTAVRGRAVYDNAFVNLRLSNGARGALWVTMAATGHEHGLRIRVYGSKASLEWQQEDPQHLSVRYLGGRREIHSAGMVGASDDAERVRRLNLGQPEGFIEALANIYRDVADLVLSGDYFPAASGDATFPTAHDGVKGLAFVDGVLASHENEGRWTPIQH